MCKWVLPDTKEYKGKDILPLRIRWLWKHKKVEFGSGMKVRRTDWDFKRQILKRTASDSLRKDFDLLEQKAHELWSQLELGQMEWDEVKSKWFSNAQGSVNSLDEVLDQLTWMKPYTFNSRRNAIRAYKKYLNGDTSSPLLLSQLRPIEMRRVHSAMLTANLSQETINTCFKGIRATINNMAEMGFSNAPKDFKIPKGIIKKKPDNFVPIIKEGVFLDSVNRISTVGQVEFMAFALLSLGLRGLDITDLLSLSAKNLYNLNDERVKVELDEFRLFSFTSEECYYFKLRRSKVPNGNQMRILIHGFTLPLIELLKMCISVTQPDWGSKDAVSLYKALDFPNQERLRRRYADGFKKLSGNTFKNIRKTYRTAAQTELGVSSELGNILLGQENENISRHYLNLEKMQKDVDDAHGKLLEHFNFNQLCYLLFKKAEGIGEMSRFKWRIAELAEHPVTNQLIHKDDLDKEKFPITYITRLLNIHGILQLDEQEQLSILIEKEGKSIESTFKYYLKAKGLVQRKNGKEITSVVVQLPPQS